MVMTWILQLNLRLMHHLVNIEVMTDWNVIIRSILKPDYQSVQPFLQVAHKRFKVVSTKVSSPVVINVTVKSENGKLWEFIKEIVKGAGFSDAMTHLTDMFSYRISSPENVGNDYTRYVNSIEAIETQYPDDVESRLWMTSKLTSMSKL